MAFAQSGFRPDYETVDQQSKTTTIQKRLIVCCDGTWFASDKGTQNLPSNVARIGRLIAAEGTAWTNESGKQVETVRVPQIVYYQSGVGTGNLTWLDKRVQGAFGHGLDESVCSAYSFLCNNYADGDEVFLFGFSRGAYTARALAGLILAAGFIPPGSMTAFYGMYQAYKKKERTQRFQDTEWWKENAEKLNIRYKHVSVKFLGVWDTVGSLGLPDSMLSQATNWNKGYQFHDTELSGRIQKAAHALALDEYRGTFSPTMWYHKGADHGYASELIQCWFPGYHAHIGGGTVNGELDESSIDDITLAWMIDQTGDTLTFDDAEIKKFVASQAQPDSHKWGEGNLTDSASVAFLAPGAGGWKTRTPGEYKPAVHEAQKRKEDDPTRPVCRTEEFIHPVVRYRMGLMQEKPKELGSIPGRVWGQTAIEKYEPAALKGFVPTVADDGFYNLLWKKPAQKKGDEEVVIREYKISPLWSGFWSHSAGVERMIVPAGILKELDETNNFGERDFIKQAPPPPPQRGYQPVG